MTYEINDALTKFRKLTNQDSNNSQIPLWESEKIGKELSTDNEYLNNWFAPRSLFELLAYRKIIIENEYEYSDLLKIILSRSARSARLVKHYDLDFPKEPQYGPYECYKHSKICTPVQEAYKFIKRYSKDTIQRITEYSTVKTDASTKVFHENSAKANFPPIDGVITSPPYVGLIDYHEQHIYAYHLLDLEDRREEEIGPAENGKSQSAKEDYKDLLSIVFSNAARSMTDDGVMIVIAGDKYDLYDDIAEDAGLEVEAVVKRHVNRRTGRRSSKFYEKVFIWRKNSL